MMLGMQLPDLDATLSFIDCPSAMLVICREQLPLQRMQAAGKTRG